MKASLLFPFISLSLFLTGCARSPRPGLSDVPDGLHAPDGVYVDVNPRWSHAGTRIAFLRATPDRRMQMHMADERLTGVRALLPPELLCPDRPYSPDLARYNSPDTLAWSPDDRRLAFARIAWFAFDDGQRLPGTGLWALNPDTSDVQPLALPAAAEDASNDSDSSSAAKLYYFHTPCWSPDGRRLAFVGEGINGQRKIFIRTLAIANGPQNRQEAMQAAPRYDTYADSDWPAWREGGGEGERGRGGEITKNTAGIPNRQEQSGFSLSPTPPISPSLAFRQGIVHALAAPRTETLRLLSPGNVRPDSAREMWRMRARDLRNVLPGYDPGLEIAPRVGHLTWSPDGRQIAFTLTPDANDYTQYALWVINADGTGARRVSPLDGRGYLAPVWIGGARLGALSPHQEKAGERRGDESESGDSQERFDVVTCELSTSRKRVLGVIASSDCDWSPDRSQIVYAMPPDARPRSPQAMTLRLLATGLRTDVSSTIGLRSRHAPR